MTSPLSPDLTRDCVAPWQYVGVRTNGDVAPCCFRPAIGNLAKANLAEILNSHEARILRASLLTGNLDEHCRKCYSRGAIEKTALQKKVEDVVAEVRLPPGFDREGYRKLNPDVATANVDPEVHFLSYGRFEGREYSSEKREPVKFVYEFDPSEYLKVRRDVANAGADPVEHFANFGQFESRLPRALKRASEAPVQAPSQQGTSRHRLIDGFRKRLTRR